MSDSPIFPWPSGTKPLLEGGLKWNKTIETGGVLVANKVRVEGEVQFVRQEE